MTTVYVLLAVIAISGSPVSLTQEFFTLKTCEKAAEMLKRSTSTTTYIAICMEK